MSWSVSALGKVVAVKNNLTTQFNNASAGTASFPEENSVVKSVEAAVMAQLDFLIANNPNAVVKVSASGSGSKAPPDGSWQSAMSSQMMFEMVHGFVE